MVLHHYDASSLGLIQYLAGLAMIEAIINEPGYEFLLGKLRLKWPNDLYSDEDGDLKKLGGILVNSQSHRDHFLLLIGFGFNIYDTPWTRSLNQVIATRGDKVITGWSKELLLARWCQKFNELYRQLITQGFPFDLYYRHWLHSGQVVFLEEEQQKVRIEGIDRNGFLLAKPHINGLLGLLNQSSICIDHQFVLQPDGNSFDMMKNLIKRKD